MRSIFQMMAMLTMLALTLFAFQTYGHELDDGEEHEHCGENGVSCETYEDVVRGYRYVSPNSDPTPYTGGSSPTNSGSDNCEGSGCVDYEDGYNPGGPEGCQHIRYDPNSGSHGYTAWVRTYDACVQRVIAEQALVSAGAIVEQQFEEACSRWNAYRADPNPSRYEVVSQIFQRAAAGASLAMICAVPLAELPPAAAAAGAFCGVVGAAYPEILDEICR